MQEPDVMIRLETVDLTQQTASVDSEKGKKETEVRRNAQLADELVFLLYEGCDTLQASFKYITPCSFIFQLSILSTPFLLSSVFISGC